MELRAMVYQLRRRAKGQPKANDLAPPCHIEPPICVATTDVKSNSQWGRRRFTRVQAILWWAARRRAAPLSPARSGRQLWQASKRAKGPGTPSTGAHFERRCLTPRSRRGPTANRQARLQVRFIILPPGLALCRWSRLNSNVRRRTRLMRTPTVIESNRSTRTQQVKALDEGAKKAKALCSSARVAKQ